jgi:hypothetical protein
MWWRGSGEGRDLIRPLATFSTQEGVEKGLDLDLPHISKFGEVPIQSLLHVLHVEKVPEGRMRSLTPLPRPDIRHAGPRLCEWQGFALLQDLN